MKVKFVKTGTIKPMKPFKTLEEEANFWDSHDAVEVFGKNIRVGIHHVPKSDTLTIRFESDDLQKLRKEADHKGLGPTTLARMWILENLRSM